jgi:alpha,alpha-trehalase
MFQYSTPDTIYAELFEAVQTSGIFEDSKTFVDALPKADPALILKSFRESDHDKGFELGSFVASNFEIPWCKAADFESDKERPVRQHIELLWDVLKRDADAELPNSSLISLPKPYIVPGGRFREIYYWDSYFTMLGLAASGRIELIQNMVDNFAFLIDRVGFIPNGNRTYYCTRSQPPLFVLMVELLAKAKQDQSILASYLTQLEKEYDFWMSGSEKLSDDLIAERRVAAVNNGYLNRYWDDSDLPRQESHAEDVELAKHCDRDASSLYRDIRSACESGWDFSSRWLADQNSLASIQASQIVPVDLNAIMYKLESTLTLAFRIADNVKRAKLFQDRANHRKQFIQSLFFDDKEGFFVDLSLPDLKSSSTLSLAAAFPLFFELATPDQARRVAERIQGEFLKPGGWVSTLNNSGQQWDAPNGWAPLQWIVFAGLKNYGFADEADLGAERWVENNLNVYSQTGRLLEKYDVEHIGALATGGEYAVQDGFGWTNGVLLSLMNELEIE